MTNDSQQSTANRTLNRRRALQLGGAGLAALTGGAGVVAGSDGEEMVEYVAFLKGNSPNRTKVWKQVPYEHWAVRHTAADLRDQVMRQIESEWGEDTVLSTKFAPLAESPTGFGVFVDYRYYHQSDGTVHSPRPSIKEVRRELQSRGTGTDEQDGHAFRREGIPIRVIEQHEFPAGCTDEGILCQDASSDWYDDNGFNLYPGGILCETGGGVNSTLAGAFKETGDGLGEGWIGSGHAINSGDSVYYPTETDTYLGDCAKNNDDWFNDVEWSWTDASDGFQGTSSDIAHDDGTGYEYDVVGIVKDSELVNDAGTTTEYRSRGRSTCELQNQIDAVHSDNDAVEYFHDIEDGDSGGPLFKLDTNGDALIAAKHTAQIQIGGDEDSDSCNDDAKGTTAETVEAKVPGEWLTS